MSFTLIAERIMNEFDWSNIAVMVKERQFPQTNFDVLLEEFKKFLLIKFIDRDIEGNLYSPSYFVDEVWQIFLLFPRGRIYYIFYSLPLQFLKSRQTISGHKTTLIERLIFLKIDLKSLLMNLLHAFIFVLFITT